MNLLAYVEVHVRVVEGGYHIVMVSALVFIVYLLLWCRLVSVVVAAPVLVVHLKV